MTKRMLWLFAVRLTAMLLLTVPVYIFLGMVLAKTFPEFFTHWGEVWFPTWKHFLFAGFPSALYCAGVEAMLKHTWRADR